MPSYTTIDEANEAIAQKIIAAQPTLVDVVRAKDVIPELEDKLILHAGPPIAFEDMPDPVQGAAIGAAIFEGWAKESFQTAIAVAYQGGTLKGAPKNRKQDCRDVTAAPVLPSNYIANARRVADRRIGLAGYRLADLLARPRSGLF